MDTLNLQSLTGSMPESTDEKLAVYEDIDGYLTDLLHQSEKHPTSLHYDEELAYEYMRKVRTLQAEAEGNSNEREARWYAYQTNPTSTEAPGQDKHTKMMADTMAGIAGDAAAEVTKMIEEIEKINDEKLIDRAQYLWNGFMFLEARFQMLYKAIILPEDVETTEDQEAITEGQEATSEG